MVTIKQLANKATLGTIGYIENTSDINQLESYILYNLNFLSEFEQIVVATNYSDLSLKEQNNKLWKRYFPNSIQITSKTNRGPSFGTADLDTMVFDFCKETKVEWLFKISNDVVINESILSKNVEESDFYYLNGISYEDLMLSNFEYEKLYKDHFFPQTNFYIINFSKIDYINDKEYLNKTYTEVNSLSNYNNKPWEYIKGWSCENFLKESVIRNSLSKKYLLNSNKHKKLCDTIKMYRIGDPSHKNIMIEGICHFQHPEQPVLEI